MHMNRAENFYHIFRKNGDYYKQNTLSQLYKMNLLVLYV